MTEYFEIGLEFARDGFAEVTGVQGLIIAIIAILRLNDWAKLVVIAGSCVIAHIALDALAPVFAESGPFEMPYVLETYFWRYVGSLYLGYLVVVGILFAVKRVVVKG
jgi:hypothetical protein